MMKGTKTELVLNHLLEHGQITPLEAIQRYGATRLAAIIFVLKNEYHYPIKTEIRQSISTVTNRVTRYANYILLK